jgi:hypothetical protein
MNVASGIVSTMAKDGAKPIHLQYLPKGPIERTPDSSFGHFSEKYPSVVIEISSSEKRKDLPLLASEYILGSRAAVSVVVGLDIEGKGNKKATISVWKPKVVNNHGILDIEVKQVVKNEVRLQALYLVRFARC